MGLACLSQQLVGSGVLQVEGSANRKVLEIAYLRLVLRNEGFAEERPELVGAQGSREHQPGVLVISKSCRHVRNRGVLRCRGQCLAAYGQPHLSL